MFGRRWRGLVLVALAGLVAVLAGSGVASGAPTPGAVVFGYTGAEQQYVVPNGVTMVRVVAIGGAGAAGAASPTGAGPGGIGGQVQADVPVAPGEPLFVEVGGSPDQPGAGGFNGGGDSRNGGGGGGGASDIRTCSRTGSTCAPGNDTLTSRLVVAAGGGGGGSPDNFDTHPGGSGGAAGAAGTWGLSPPFPGSAGGPGDPGTASAGGDVAQENNVPAAGSPGVFGAGGAASAASGQGGGGGGGGWFGGAAGGTSTGVGAPPGGGGGGGSSYAIAAAQNVSIQLATTNVPSISITPLSPTADLSAGTISFPPSQVGTSTAAQNVTVTNNGLAPLQITGLALQGTDRLDFGLVATNCGAAVSPGADCQVSLHFSPQAAGARAASLVLSADGLADQTVTLSGTGTAPPAVVPTVPPTVTPPASGGPPSGLEHCRGRRARECTISFPSSALGLGPRSGAKLFALKRGRIVIRGTASVRHGIVQFHTHGHARPGSYLLTVWKVSHRTRHVLRLLTVEVN